MCVLLMKGITLTKIKNKINMETSEMMWQYKAMIKNNKRTET